MMVVRVILNPYLVYINIINNVKNLVMSNIKNIIKENINSNLYYVLNSEKEYDVFIDLMKKCNIDRYRWCKYGGNKPKSYPVYGSVNITDKLLSDFRKGMSPLLLADRNSGVHGISEICEKYRNNEVILIKNVHHDRYNADDKYIIYYAKDYKIKDLVLKEIDTKDNNATIQSKIEAEVEAYKKKLAEEVY